MPFANINDVDIYYEIHGKDEPLMLVAGLASDSQSWLPILKELSRNYQVIIFDNRNVGRTKPQAIRTSIQLMADDCIGLIKFLGLSSVYLLGHSMGGFIALDCAIRYPNYISKLILAATSASISGRNKALLTDWCSYLESGMDLELWFKNMFYWIFSKSFFDDKQSVKDAIQYALDYPFPQSNAAFQNQVNATNEYNCTEDLHKIIQDTKVICGMNDMLFPTDEIETHLKTIPNVDFSYIENAAHSIHMEKPLEFVKIVKGFLCNRTF